MTQLDETTLNELVGRVLGDLGGAVSVPLAATLGSRVRRLVLCGPSGMGAYHGIEGFRAMSHAKGVFVQGRWNFPGLLHAPFGKLADMAISLTLGRNKASSP